MSAVKKANGIIYVFLWDGRWKDAFSAENILLLDCKSTRSIALSFSSFKGATYLKEKQARK